MYDGNNREYTLELFGGTVRQAHVMHKGTITVDAWAKFHHAITRQKRNARGDWESVDPMPAYCELYDGFFKHVSGPSPLDIHKKSVVDLYHDDEGAPLTVAVGTDGRIGVVFTIRGDDVTLVFNSPGNAEINDFLRIGQQASNYPLPRDISAKYDKLGRSLLSETIGYAEDQEPPHHQIRRALLVLMRFVRGENAGN